ncbi:MAG: glycosyltransferase family 4 protein [Candidatus Babeliales bacterium]
MAFFDVVIQFVALLAIELAYFKLANRLNIIDQPNERSSHTRSTLRGGGVIFYVGALLFFIWSGFQYPWFFAGLSLITLVSFTDDFSGVPNRIRIGIHLLSVGLMFSEIGLLDETWWLVGVALVVTIGIINAYNFMDGINGITGGYSFVVLAGLGYVNTFQVAYAPNELILFTLLSLLVFNIFNFRPNARCFAGDVGSVSMAFIILFLLASLMLSTQNLIYILFLAVYGVDSVLTIVIRLWNRENIFRPHRSHLYQRMANEGGFPHILVSLYYMAVQAMICIVVIWITGWSLASQLVISFLCLGVLAGIYVGLSGSYRTENIIQTYS